MLYEDLMMDTSMKIRYNMLRLLTTLADGHYSIFFIAQKLNLTYQQTYHHLNELNREIQQVDSHQHTILIKNSGIDTEKLVLSLDEYRYFLLQESIPFRFTEYILNAENPSLEEFCDEMFISRSTLSRKIKALTEFLRNYNIRISYTAMSLVGDETKIRLVLFYLMWLGTRGIVWPFAFSEEELAYFHERFTPFFSLKGTFIGQKELQFFYGVTYARIKRGYFADYNSKYDFLFADSEFYDLTLMDDYPNLSSEVARGEAAFLFFLSLFASYFSEGDDPVLEKTIAEFSRNENPVFKLAEDFIKTIEETLFSEPFSTEDRTVLLGNLLHITFSYYVFVKSFPDLHSFVVSEKDQPISSYLSQTVDNFFERRTNQKDFIPFKRGADELAEVYKRTVLPYFVSQQKMTRLTVGLALEQNHFFIQQLVTFLENLNFVTFESFVDEPKKYDLVISSSFTIKKAFPDIPFYYWDLDYTYDELIYLYQKLRKIYVEKNK